MNQSSKAKKSAQQFLKMLLLVSVLSVSVTDATAGAGHDEGESVEVSENTPRRYPDGKVFFPKPVQRQLQIRTMRVDTQIQPKALTLAGKIIMDPNAGGRIQTTQSGRVEAPPEGLPNLGQVVKKGQVLAYIQPSFNALERANQAAQLAELNAARQLAQKRYARLRELADTVPKKDIEAAESDVISLRQRAAAVGGGLFSREKLVAPVSGIVASATPVTGQVVAEGELLYEIVDPKKLFVEALVYEAGAAGNVGSAAMFVGGNKVSLRFVGAAKSLREQALPVLFAAEDGDLSLFSIGQPVTLFVQTAEKVEGIPVPASSIMKNASNQSIVWVKASPEVFEPRIILMEQLDGASIMVTSGLKAGERVVTNGATLINQVR